MANTHTFKPCPRCRKQIPIEAVACMFCGWTSVPAQSPVAPTFTSPVAPSSPNVPAASNATFTPISTCFNCGSTQIQKVTAVVDSQTWHSKGSTVGVGVAHVSHGPNVVGVNSSTTRTTGQTDLAQLLARPTKPKDIPDHVDSAGCMFGCATFIVTSLGLSIAVGNARQDSSFTWIAMVVGVVVGFIIYALCYTANKAKNKDGERQVAEKRRAQQDRFERQIEFYERLSYCSSCHCVLDPVTKRAINAKALKDAYNHIQ